MTQRAASQTGNTAHAGRARALDHVQSLSARVFGPTRLDVGESVGNAEDATPDVPVNEIEQLIEERKLAKQRREFARADEIRKTLADRGILLEDTPAGTRWKKK